MKNIFTYLVLFLFTISSLKTHAQCGSPSSHVYGGDINPSCSWQTRSGVGSRTEWDLKDQTVGVIFQVSLCNGGGSVPSGYSDTQLTGWDESTGALAGYNDDFCGLGSEFTFTGIGTNDVDILYNKYNCAGWNGAGTANSATLAYREVPQSSSTSLSGGGTICTGGSRTLSRTGTPPTGYNWYWQTSTSGTSTGIGSGSTLSASPGSTTTYYIRSRSNSANQCWGPATSGVTVTVVADPTAPTITGTTTICSGGSATITRIHSGSGGTGTVITQWQRRAGTSGTFVDFGTDNSSSTSTGTLTGTYQYRLLREASGSGCGVGTSNTITVTVVADPTAPTITGTTTICSGGSATITRTNPGSGGTGTVITQWQRRAGTSGTFVDFGTDNSSSTSTGTLTGTYQYRLLREATGNGCGVGTSNIVTVTVVADPTAPTITGTTTICSGGSATITRTNSGSGGTGTVITQWQRRAGTSGTFVDFGTDNSSSTSTGTLTGTYQYRLLREATGVGCGVGTSNIVTVTVVADPTAPTITGTTTICSGGSATITRTNSGSGGTGTVITQWQRRAGTSGTFVDFGTDNSSSTSTGTLTGTYQYRLLREATGVGCGTGISNTVTVTVVADPTAPSITGTTTICSGGSATITRTGSGTGGTGTVITQWQRRAGTSGTFVDFGTVNTSSISTGTLTGTYQYRLLREATGVGCGVGTSNVVTVTVDSPINITSQPAASTSICHGGGFAPNVTATGVGLTYQWQYFNGSSWLNVVAGQPAASFSYVNTTNPTTFQANTTNGTPAGTYSFRCSIVTSGPCPDVVSNTASLIVVNDPIITVIGYEDVCFGGSATLTVSAVTGGLGAVSSYQWYDGGGAISGANAVSYSTSTSLSVGTYQYRVNVGQSVSGCFSTNGFSSADVIADPASPIITKSPDVTSVCDGETLTVTTPGGTGGVGCTDEYRYTIDNVSNWSAWSTTIPVFSASNSVSNLNRIQSRRTCTGSGCNTPFANEVVWQVQDGPSISLTGGSSICEGGNVTLTSTGSGGIGSVTNQWQMSTTGSTPWTNVGSNTNLYNTGALNTPDTYYYRVLRITGCGNDTSNIESVIVRSESTDPTSAAANSSFVCSGDAVTLTVTGGSLGTGATWEWYSDAALTSSVGNGSPLVVNPTSTETYYVRAEGTCNNTSVVNTGAVVVNGSATAPTSVSLPSGAGTYTSTCTVNDAAWHYFYTSSGELLAAIKSSAVQTLGSVTVSIEVGNPGPFGTGLPPGVCGYPGASGGEYALARNWDITVGTQPVNPVDVKFYYENSEIGDLTTNIANLPTNSTNYINCWGNVTSEGDLMMTVDHGGSLETPPISFAAGPSGTIREVSFALSQFSSGKLHSSNGMHSGNSLPVELLSFEAKPIDNEYIALNWATATEINNEGFELLRSTDGTSFEKITWIEGNGNTNEQQSYSFNDTKVSNGTYYYKLRQIDFDGESEEFDVVSATITRNSRTIPNIRPNPTSSSVKVDIESATNGEAIVTIYNYTGSKVYQSRRNINEGNNTLLIEETKDFANGIYHIIIEINEETFTKKFVVSK